MRLEPVNSLIPVSNNIPFKKDDMFSDILFAHDPWMTGSLCQ